MCRVLFKLGWHMLCKERNGLGVGGIDEEGDFPTVVVKRKQEALS